jgi:hypothetical protein
VVLVGVYRGDNWFVIRVMIVFVTSLVTYATVCIFAFGIMNLWLVFALAVGCTLLTVCGLFAFYSTPRLKRW